MRVETRFTVVGSESTNKRDPICPCILSRVVTLRRRRLTRSRLPAPIGIELGQRRCRIDPPTNGIAGSIVLVDHLMDPSRFVPEYNMVSAVK